MGVVRGKERPIQRRGLGWPPLQKTANYESGTSQTAVWRNWAATGEEVKPHTHDVEEVILVVAGRMEATIERERYLLDEGDALVVPPRAVHGFRNPGPGQLAIVASFPKSDPDTLWQDPTDTDGFHYDQRAIDPAYLRYQYGDSERLRIRGETHRLYSEHPVEWVSWVLEQVEPRAGELVADVGCGAGFYHAPLLERGCLVVALDYSAGMLAELDRRVATAQADAQALPLRNAAFDLTMANHMLYHVPDQVAAMRELRRVTRPGGRVVMATNGSVQNERLLQIHAACARELGLTSTVGLAQRFTLDHVDLVRSVFPEAEVRLREDAFVFPSAEPALRYYASGLVDSVLERDGAHRPLLLELMGAKIEEIVAREGVFRVPKPAGCFVARL